MPFPFLSHQIFVVNPSLSLSKRTDVIQIAKIDRMDGHRSIRISHPRGLAMMPTWETGMPMAVSSEVDVNDVIDCRRYCRRPRLVISLTCICTTRHTGPESGLTPKK